MSGILKFEKTFKKGKTNFTIRVYYEHKLNEFSVFLFKNKKLVNKIMLDNRDDVRDTVEEITASLGG